MISERTISRGFQSVWSSHFPMLNSSFVVSLNRHFTKPITSSEGVNAAIVKPPSHHTSHDLVAELGIQLAKKALSLRCSSQQAAQDTELLASAWKDALKLVNRYEGERTFPALEKIASDWIKDAILLSSNLCVFIESHQGELEFDPTISGTRSIPTCEADLCIGDLLVEVKTVSRRFSTQDLRQVLIYLALDWANGAQRWERACLVNPRRAIYAMFSVDWLVKQTSGRSCAEVFGEFLDSFNRDIELEVSF